LTALDLSSFYTKLLRSGRKDAKGGLAPRTVWHFDRLLHKALRDAVRQRLIAFNSADEVEHPTVEKRRPITLTRDGFLKLLKVAGQRSYAGIVLIFTAGVRPGELLALRDRDVHLDAGQVEIVRSLCETKAKGLFFKDLKSKSSNRRVTLPASTARCCGATGSR
jgi:integrase